MCQRSHLNSDGTCSLLGIIHHRSVLYLHIPDRTAHLCTLVWDWRDAPALACCLTCRSKDSHRSKGHTSWASSVLGQKLERRHVPHCKISAWKGAGITLNFSLTSFCCRPHISGDLVVAFEYSPTPPPPTKQVYLHWVSLISHLKAWPRTNNEIISYKG